MEGTGEGTGGLPGDFFGWSDRELAEEFAGGIELFALAGGEESVATGVVNAFLGDMAEEAGEEFMNGEGHEEGVSAGFIFVTEEDGIVRVEGDAATGNRTAADVAPEIVNDAATVFVGGHDLDMPFGTAEFVEEVETTLWGEVRRRAQPGFLKGLS
jgi:hypothetical protein